MLPLAVLANPRNIAIGILTAAVIGLVIALRLAQASAEVANMRANALGARLVSLNEEVKRAAASLRECGTVNDHNTRELQAAHQATGALRAVTERLNGQLKAARTQAATLLAENDANDTEFERRPDLQPVTQLNADLRKRGAGWLWR